MAYIVTNNPWSSQYNVGIGIETPCSTLHVFGAGATMRLGPYYSDQDRDYLFFEAGGTNSQIITRNESMTIHNCGGPLILNPSGQYVGIGTSSPAFRLHVNGSGADTIGFIGASGMTANQSIFFQIGKNCTSLSNAGEISFKYIGDNNSCNMVSLGFYGNGEKLNVQASGRVGIGTSSPSELLTIGSGGKIAAFKSDNTRRGVFYTNNDGTVVESDVTGNDPLFLSSPGASGTVRIQTGGTTRMSVGDNVGIGTTSPATNLHICDANALGRDDMIRLTQGNVNNHAYVRSERCNGAMVLMGATRNSFDGCIPSDSGIVWSFCNNPIIIGTCNRERVRFASNGSVGIGITSPSYQLHVNGTFYAAGSSQDYKEGICQYNTDSCLFMCLKPKAYQYKEEWKHLGKDLKSGTQIGLIAEEVAESHPELAVLVNEEDNQVVRNVDYEKLSIILLAEVQKLRQEVDQLNQK